ncbi:TIGR01777 family oxidoreductase [Myxosarcina sp. GI1]|uniref:thylakoid membrane protein ThyD n=1 Tax=Myxosarcina sp. GI1 TaxID=1541065 RepID=UPI00055BD604|nr:TIGR01777 family oxidoreductase [Myxosarcina sp. GI1]
MKIAITGATGLVGTRLVEKLNSEGHQILVFTRNSDKAKRIFPSTAYPNLEVIKYTPDTSGEWQKKVSGSDAVVNLAGEPLAERWTKSKKQAIMDSRKQVTEKIVEAIAQAKSKPQVLVSGSAIGYYGTSETATFEESSDSGNDFLARVCQEWEAAAKPAKEYGVRLVILRIGIVLANGGALGKMIGPFKMFAGGPIGSGKQWFSWIHREDLVNLICEAIANSNLEGVYNATAPNPVRMNQLSHTLGKVMNRPSWLPVPDFVLEMLLADGAQVVLEGQQVLPKRTQAAGFDYQYPELQPALTEIVS